MSDHSGASHDDAVESPKSRSEHQVAEGFVESSTGLRDVVVERDRPRWYRRLRYVPLAVVVVLAVLAGGVGVWYRETHPSSDGSGGDTSATSSVVPSDGTTRPSSCVGPIRALELGPWDQEDTSASEAEFAAGIASATAWVDGRDGFRFWSDAYNSNISQAVGRTHVDDAQMAAWATYISKIQTAADKSGAVFLLMVAPAKWDVYANELPAWSDALTGPTSLMRMRAGHPEFPWVDVANPLAEIHGREPGLPLYSRVNSHWSPYAAGLAWDRALECLSDIDTRFSVLPHPDVMGWEVTAPPDEFAQVGAEPSDTDDWSVPVYSEDLGDVQVVSIQTGKTQTTHIADGLDFADLPVMTSTASAPDMTLLVARDSMGNALSTGMMSSFGRTIQVRNGLDVDEPVDLPGLIEHYAPDVVILELAERYLVQTP